MANKAGVYSGKNSHFSGLTDKTSIKWKSVKEACDFHQYEPH